MGDESSAPPSLPVEPGANSAPTISGVPSTSAKPSVLYDFTPSAYDRDGDTLRFEITGRPTWATFNPNTGRLYGTPAASAVGTYAGITIVVTDGVARATLAPFTITVTDSATTGVAELVWTPPTKNVDGSQLTDLAGYKIYYGVSPGALTETREITDPSARGTTIGPLNAGTWYFALSSYTTSGVESSRTWPVSKTI